VFIFIYIFGKEIYIKTMWLEEVSLDNIKCFDKVNLRLGSKDAPYPWVTLLGENGGGKSTILQALGLLLAGPEGSQFLLKRPTGWLRNENRYGTISAQIHKSDNDPGTFGTERQRKAFRYSFFVTGDQKITIRNQQFTEPSIIENKDRVLSWLRENALSSKGKGWFAIGFGAFRRLTRDSQIIVPSLQPPARYSNFLTQFNENEPLVAFERWMVYLDYRIVKDNDKIAERQKAIGIQAIDRVLPEGVQFDSVNSDGRILFNINGQKVPTINLSDGYRSILALAGDLIWRLLEAFPESQDPLKEEGIVLIDELDIHLHPTWQRTIAGWLRDQFPKMQFIVATHSPLIAAGAGEDAVTYRFSLKNNVAVFDKVPNIAAWSVDRILESEAFGLVSAFSPETQEKIDKYHALKRKENQTKQDKNELQLLLPFVKDALLFQEPSSFEDKIDNFLKNAL
jgi:energy-coupling factor transporter ATP-binding protein EcfA2